MVSDNRSALDFALGILPDIERVGAVGCSMGGLSALFLSLHDQRVEDVLISGILLPPPTRALEPAPAPMPAPPLD